MRLRGAAIFTAVALSFTGAAHAQKPGSPAPPPPPSTGGNTTGNTNTRQPTTTFPNDNATPQVIFISGTVVLSDGLPLPERVKIERVCSGLPAPKPTPTKKDTSASRWGRILKCRTLVPHPLSMVPRRPWET
jgi:hypothetical protein